ncbi:AAWKG family protein [Streptomyces sp. NBC_00490]|uniref:AAWKG family protein n=1 Tax=Streptomyces sp. NBC_00490 TaxID=2903657 RepID=UPI002E18A90D|nr:AAWKG family protein [Streptomyces sp. NBC_00490]
MADRYDASSVANLDKFDNAGDPSSDTWATLVTHITGYPVPDRNTVFDTLRSEHGGKLFRMDIKERSLSVLVKDSGFLTNKGEDYDIWFFDSGKKRSIMQARIVFEGRVKAGEEIIFAGPGSDNVHDAQVREGNEFTDYNKDKMSTIPLARYMNGPRAALLALLGGSTTDARFSNLGVPGADVVDLNSFNTTGESFDFAAKFFKDHAVVLKDWEDRFSRDDASWKGEAAEVFRSLLKKIRENYDSYVETFNSSPGAGDGTGTGATVYSRALSLGRKYLEDAANKLLEAWLAWAKSPYYDPHQVLRYVLDDLAQWVDANNVAKTDIKSYTSRYTTTVSHSPQAGFTQVHPEYGDLTDIANWAKVGDKAVKIWSQGVDEYLGKPAAEVQSNLNNHFLDLGDDFSDNVPKPKSTSTASEEYEEKKAEEEQEEINRQNEENRRYQDELRAEQERQREEDKKYQDELRAEQNRQREEDKKYQDELRAEQNRQREEDKRLQDELRNEQNQQRDEDKKYQDELREEQRREQEEAKRQAEEQAKAMEESLGGINNPNGVTQQNLDGLDDLLNQNNPVTESLGDLGDVNSQGGDQQAFTSTPPPGITNLGNLGSVNTGPGGTNNAANDAVTQNLGNLGGLNTGGGSVKTPTGGNTQLDGGKLTTDFPDGSSTSFDPDSGVLTTTHPDGSVTTQNLDDGTRVTNPDGSVTSLGDDGKLTTTFPDGSVQTVDPTTGQVSTTDPDGTTTTQDLGNLGGLNGQSNNANLGDLGDINSNLPTQSEGDLDDLGNLNTDQNGLETPTGGSTQLSDGDIATDFPDGSRISFDPDSGLLTSTNADGTTTTTDLTHGATVTNPDGSKTSLDNGMLTTEFPDGSKQVIDPDTGIATVTDPQGNTERVDLHDLNSQGSGDASDILDGLGDLESIGGLNDTGGGTSTQDLSLSDLGLSGGAGDGTSGGGVGESYLTADSNGGTGADPLSDGAAESAGSPLAPAATAGTPGAPGMPGSPGMPMGGMGAGGMGAGGDKGNGERVRAVLVDAAEESERRNRRRRSPWNRQEDDDTFLAPASRVATTGGDSPEEETETGRNRATSSDYLEEDADVWGTEEGGTPAVIGR